MNYKRIFLVVIDSLGVGALPDAKEYGDEGSDTLGHICQELGGIKIPNLVSLGIANLHKLPFVEGVENPKGYAQYLLEKSVGKDTLTGHWEMMGVETKNPFKVFTETGFPQDLIKVLEKNTGRTIIGNKSASGTQILEECAREEIEDGKLIVYTSADSVLQICGEEHTMGLETLYNFCEMAREVTMKEDWKVARIIARPYVVKDGAYIRTSNRHDYALSPPQKTCLDVLKENDYDVISIGKIEDIFNGNGITKGYKSTSSVHGMEQTIDIIKKDFTGLCFTNLVDFDALWGHRRNPQGYGKELEIFDEKLGELLKVLDEDDLLILTSDHGNDPTYKGTDHTREKTFLLAYSKSMKESRVLEPGRSFGNIGATILENFKLEKPKEYIGESILSVLK